MSDRVTDPQVYCRFKAWQSPVSLQESFAHHRADPGLPLCSLPGPVQHMLQLITSHGQVKDFLECSPNMPWLGAGLLPTPQCSTVSQCKPYSWSFSYVYMQLTLTMLTDYMSGEQDRLTASTQQVIKVSWKEGVQPHAYNSRAHPHRAEFPGKKPYKQIMCICSVQYLQFRLRELLAQNTNH